MFELLNDMGGLRGTAETALKLQAQIPNRNGLVANGLFVVHNDKKISEAEFRRLCAIEAFEHK